MDPTAIGGFGEQESVLGTADAAQTSAAAADKNKEKKTVKYSFKGNRAGKPTSNRLSYPHDKVYTDHTDYVKFKFVKYNPPFASMDGNDFLDKNGKLTKNIDSSEAASSSSGCLIIHFRP